MLKQLDLVKNTVPLCETKPNRIRYGQEEIDYAKDLIGWSFSEVERKRPANEELVVPRDALTVTAERRLNSKGGSSSRKLVKFEDCSEGTFVDICGEVRFLLSLFLLPFATAIDYILLHQGYQSP